MSKKIITFLPLYKEFQREKKGCKCYEYMQSGSEIPSYILDMENRIVECGKCHKEVDPFDALCVLSQYSDRLARCETEAYEWILEAEKYKPWRRAMKDIERNIGRKGDMIPVCPHCGEGFLLEEVRGYMNRQLYKPDKEEK